MVDMRGNKVYLPPHQGVVDGGYMRGNKVYLPPHLGVVDGGYERE